MALFKYIVLSVCLCGIHLNGFAQSTREAILEDIARTGGVYYAYPVKEAIATPPPKGYKPFYISHYARHGSRWIQSEQDYKTVVDIFEKAHQAGVLTALGEDVRKRMALVWEDAEGHGGDLTPLGVRQHRGIAERMFQNYPEVFKGARLELPLCNRPAIWSLSPAPPARKRTAHPSLHGESGLQPSHPQPLGQHICLYSF